jgi:protein-tyrosine phosphatase
MTMSPSSNQEIRTSTTHPLRIAALPVNDQGGAIGVTFAPGKHQSAAMTGIWERDLSLDLESICRWKATHLITLLEPHELDELKITQLPQKAIEAGLQWYGLPITDGAPPDERFLGPWRTLSPTFIRELCEGRRIVVHCKGGLGRAGTVACLLLIDSGCASDADDAMKRVRSVRPGAIETLEQETFLRAWPQQNCAMY